MLKNISNIETKISNTIASYKDLYKFSYIDPNTDRKIILERMGPIGKDDEMFCEHKTYSDEAEANLPCDGFYGWFCAGSNCIRMGVQARYEYETNDDWYGGLLTGFDIVKIGFDDSFIYHKIGYAEPKYEKGRLIGLKQDSIICGIPVISDILRDGRFIYWNKETFLSDFDL